MASSAGVRSLHLHAMQSSSVAFAACRLTSLPESRPGANDRGQCNIPSGLSNVVQVASRVFHTCAVKNDGSLACWGEKLRPECC